MDWILPYRTDELTWFFRMVTKLGDSVFILIALPLGYWLWRKRTFTRLFVLLLFCDILNAHLKSFFDVARPPQSLHLINATEGSSPAGHPQLMTTLWTWLAIELRKGWFYPVAAAVILLVGTSRIYLGVHWVPDILAGMGVGLTIVAAFWLLLKLELAWWYRLNPLLQGALLFLGLLVWWSAMPEDAPVTTRVAGGMLIGFWVGASTERRVLDFRFPPGVARRIVAAALGLGGIFFMWGVVLPRTGVDQLHTGLATRAQWVGSWLGMAVLGLWISLGAPALFRLTRLVERGRGEPEADAH